MNACYHYHVDMAEAEEKKDEVTFTCEVEGACVLLLSSAINAIKKGRYHARIPAFCQRAKRTLIRH